MIYEAHLDLMKLGKTELMQVIDEIAQGGRWYCGVEGNKKLAKKLRVRPADLETLSAWCWNRVAYFHSASKEAESVYRKICNIQYNELPAHLRWSFDLNKPPRWHGLREDK